MTEATQLWTGPGAYEFVHRPNDAPRPQLPLMRPLSALGPQPQTGLVRTELPPLRTAAPADRDADQADRTNHPSAGPDQTADTDRSTPDHAATADAETGQANTDRAPTPREGPGKSSRPVAAWPLLLLAAPAGVATWSGWVGLGERTGFGKVKPLPGVWEDLAINTAITLPIGVEAYAAYALNVWLSHRPMSKNTRRFAKVSSIGSLILGAAGQIAYHLLEVSHAATINAAETKAAKNAAEAVHAPWWITMLVSCLPVLVLGMGAALHHMLRSDAHATPTHQDDQQTAAEQTDTGTAAADADLAQVSGPSATIPDRAADRTTVPDRTDRPTLSATDTSAADSPDREAASVPDRTETNRTPRQQHRRTARPAPATADTHPAGTNSSSIWPVDAAKLADARRAAAELDREDVSLSRRALRSKGVKGENKLLGQLVQILNEEREERARTVMADA